MTEAKLNYERLLISVNYQKRTHRHEINNGCLLVLTSQNEERAEKGF
jgi:hypothetical protein